MSTIHEGGFVRSLDERDEPDLFYVVLEMDVGHVSGNTVKIAEPGDEDRTFRYRLLRYLRSVDDEVAKLVEQAQMEVK